LPLGRILIATIGSLGDLHPYIAVARALKARGRDAVIATAPEYRADIEKAGVGFAPVGPGFAHFGDYRKVMEKLFDVRTSARYLIADIVMPHLRTTYEDLSRAAEGASLLVSHPLTLALPLIAAKKNLPWAATVLAPANFFSTWDPPVIAGAEWMYGLRRLGRTPYRVAFSLAAMALHRWEAPYRAFRRELGLPPLTSQVMLAGQFSPYLNLGLFDAPLAQPQPDWPRNVRVTGAPLHDGSFDVQNELNKFLDAGDPPIVFALGSSAVWVAGDFWRHAVEASRALGRRAILITGRDTPGVANLLPADSPEVRAFGYLPYSVIFPRAAAIVHQAGIGTLSQALRSGRPQLIVPFAFDQPDNARRAAALDLARVLPLKKLDALSLSSELKILLEGKTYDNHAQRVAEELRGVNGAECAADELLKLENA
jgi:rhamnosyltransferase subunit B